MRFGTRKGGTPVAIAEDKTFPLSEAGFKGGLRELAAQDPGEVRRIHDAAVAGRGAPLDVAQLAAPIENPSKIVAIGLNYVDHASETKLDLPDEPLVFAKFPTSLTGPVGEIENPVEAQ